MKLAAFCIAAAITLVVALLYATAKPPPVGILIVALASVVFFAGMPVMMGKVRAANAPRPNHADRVIVRSQPAAKPDPARTVQAPSTPD